MDTVVWLVSTGGIYDRKLHEHLAAKGYVVIGVGAGQHELPREAQGPEILLLDIADPHGSEDIFEWVARSSLPKLFLLPLYGDDVDAFVLDHDIRSFVIKPCIPEAVEHHVRILLRKSFPTAFRDASEIKTAARRQEPPPRNRMTFEDAVNIDDAAKTAIVEGRVVELTPKEFALLRLLSSRPGRVFSNEEILESVWSGSKRASSLDVQQYVHHLRRKVESNPHHPRWIKNVKGFGYKLDRHASG